MAGGKGLFRAVPARAVARLVVKSLVLCGALLLVLLFVALPWRATGNSMSPFVRDGDLCVFYRLGTLSTKDVVLYRRADGDLAIGRIVARPGQVVEVFSSGGYTVDGYLPSEEVPYETYPAGVDAPSASGSGDSSGASAFGALAASEGSSEGDALAEEAGVSYPYVLGDGEFFVMNDFRSLSSDSRLFGAVTEEDILGNLLFLLRRRSF